MSNLQRQQTVKEFIIDNKFAIYKAFHEPEQKGLTPGQKIIVDKARKDIGYAEVTGDETIWRTLSKQYYKI